MMPREPRAGGAEKFCYVLAGQLPSATKPVHCGKHLCVEMCGYMNCGVAQSKPNRLNSALVG
jgi:hypothetical protein